MSISLISAAPRVLASTAVFFSAVAIGVCATALIESDMVGIAMVFGAAPALAGAVAFFCVDALRGTPSLWLGGSVGFLLGTLWLIWLTTDLAFALSFGAIAGLAGFGATLVGVRVLGAFGAPRSEEQT